MARLVALVLCTAHAVLAETPAAAASLRGGSATQEGGVAEKIAGADRRLTGDGEVDPARAYSHVGCYADSKPDRVLGHLMKSPEMSSEVCSEHCYDRRATYMATQHGNECWCSRDPELNFDRHTVVVDGEYGLCNMYCYGNEGETCGGYEAFDLYKIDEPMEPDSPEYVGCFADDQDDRLLTHEIKFQDDMTQAVCRAHCEAFDSLFYATQFGNECWCGLSDDVEDYKRHRNGTCLAGCFGDPAIACGGYDAFTLYEYLDEVWETAAPCTSTSTTSTYEETDSPTSSPTGAPGGDPTSTCSNGIPGLESPNGACCVAACTQCGGLGCSTSGAALGLGSAECCEGTILENAKPCGEAPCVIGGGVDATPSPVAPVTPAPVMPEPMTPAPVVPVTPAPVDPTSAPVMPKTPAPVMPTRAPVTPETPAPVTPATPAPVTPETPAPVTPETPAPITPETPAPITPETPSPVTPTPGPVAPETPYPVIPTPEPVAEPPVAGDDAGDYQDLLDRHNQIRCMHGTAPMVWSDEVASFARDYAAEMTSSGMCSQMIHSSGSGYGENLYMCWGSTSCYSSKGALVGWYDEEVLEGGPTTYEGHATQVLWSDSTELGCAVATCDKSGTPYTFLTCNYNPPGNWRGETETYVMPPSKSEDECGYDGTRARN